MTWVAWRLSIDARADCAGCHRRDPTAATQAALVGGFVARSGTRCPGSGSEPGMGNALNSTTCSPGLRPKLQSPILARRLSSVVGLERPTSFRTRSTTGVVVEAISDRHLRRGQRSCRDPIAATMGSRASRSDRHKRFAHILKNDGSTGGRRRCDGTRLLQSSSATLAKDVEDGRVGGPNVGRLRAAGAATRQQRDGDDIVPTSLAVTDRRQRSGDGSHGRAAVRRSRCRLDVRCARPRPGRVVGRSALGREWDERRQINRWNLATIGSRRIRLWQRKGPRPELVQARGDANHVAAAFALCDVGRADVRSGRCDAGRDIEFERNPCAQRAPWRSRRWCTTSPPNSTGRRRWSTRLRRSTFGRGGVAGSCLVSVTALGPIRSGRPGGGARARTMTL